MTPDVAGLLSKRLSAMGWANAVGTNIGVEARAESMKFEVAPESIRVGMVSDIPRIQVETKKRRVGSRSESCRKGCGIYRESGVQICHVTQGAHRGVRVAD